jgi:hypothetical protein
MPMTPPPFPHCLSYVEPRVIIVLAVVMAAADREVVFGPNDLRAGLEAAGG